MKCYIKGHVNVVLVFPLSQKSGASCTGYTLLYKLMNPYSKVIHIHMPASWSLIILSLYWILNKITTIKVALLVIPRVLVNLTSNISHSTKHYSIIISCFLRLFFYLFFYLHSISLQNWTLGYISISSSHVHAYEQLQLPSIIILCWYSKPNIVTEATRNIDWFILATFPSTRPS